jgi:class 3 adenylate cyclase
MQDDPSLGDERQPTLERRLATIMVADVAGYSRMMGENEERTVQTLQGHREIFDALLRMYRGRIFNTAGDAILAEFPSAVQAVRCATEIQAALRTRNEKLLAEQPMWFRIGINLGDVIVQGGDLLGDGVNVAARIQTIAEPGGICISGSVYDQIQNKLSLKFKMMGEHSFKNIAQPIRTFSITEGDDAGISVSLARERPAWRKSAGIAAALVLIVAVTGGGYWIYRDYDARRAEEVRRAVEVERQSAEAERKASEERLAAEARQQQEKFEAEAQLAKLALQKANEERLAAEARQQQAKLEAEAQAARMALRQAEAEKLRRDQEAKRAATQGDVKDLQAPARKPGTAQGDETKVAGVQEGQRTMKPPDAEKLAKAPRALDRFDGTYEGRMCTERRIESKGMRCWPVTMRIEQGKLQANWTVKILNKSASARGTISQDGSVSLTVEGWLPDGRPTEGNMTGRWREDAIDTSGTWKNGPNIIGNWKRAY